MKPEAIILAGGKGTRLRSVVSDVPKPMAPVAGKPFLTYVLDQLVMSGITEAKLSVGYKHEVIKRHFGDRYDTINLTYVVENEPLGTGGGIRLAAESCSSDHVLVMNGDTFFDVELPVFMQLHEDAGNAMTIALKSMDNVDRYGTVRLKGNRIEEFVEKSPGAGAGLINGGIYGLNRKLFLEKTSPGTFSMEVDFMQKEVGNLVFGGVISTGHFVDIGIPEDYQKAQEYFGNRRA